MANLTLVSPLRGWCAPLDETPDAVFAQRLLGDGVAIDPTGGRPARAVRWRSDFRRGVAGTPIALRADERR